MISLGGKNTVGQLFCCLFFHFLKVEKKPIAVTSYFPPENIGPAMAGYLIDDSADNRDLISLLPLWARQGFLKMKEVKEKGTSDMELIKLKSLPEDAETYEHIIFNGLFPAGTNSIKTSDLAEKFYVTMDSAKNDLISRSKIYYDDKKTGAADKKGCVISILAIPVALLFWYFWGAWVGIIAGGIIFVIAAMGISKVKNAKGSLIQSELLGFQNFIKLSDVKRIETLLKDDPDYYEKTMPYAVAFDLLEPWTKNLEQLGVQPPEWYEPASGGESGGGW